MTESIGIRLYQLLGGKMHLNLYEAETTSYPYVSYEYTAEPVLSKDGIEKYSAEVIFYIVSDTFDEAQTLSETIQETLRSDMMTDGYSASLRSSQPTCEEGIWTLELNYLINQYK